MKGLSSLERIILECIGKEHLSYEDIHKQTGLHAHVCFNLIQALIIKGLIKAEGGHYRISESISPLMMEEINSIEAKQLESLEMIEAIVEQQSNRTFRFQKIAMDERDEKIFLAMLSNLESFIRDAHKKAQSLTPLKEYKVIFWGVSEVQNVMNHIIRGN